MNNCLTLTVVRFFSFLFAFTISFFLNFCHLQKNQSGLHWVAFCFIWLEDQGQIVKSSINRNFSNFIGVQSSVFESSWSQSIWGKEHRTWEIIIGRIYLEVIPLYPSLLLGGILVMVFFPLQTTVCEVKPFQLLLWEKDTKMNWSGSSQLLNVRAKILLGHKAVWSHQLPWLYQIFGTNSWSHCGQNIETALGFDGVLNIS